MNHDIENGNVFVLKQKGGTNNALFVVAERFETTTDSVLFCPESWLAIIERNRQRATTFIMNINLCGTHTYIIHQCKEENGNFQINDAVSLRNGQILA
jgi:hypothetical protein